MTLMSQANWFPWATVFIGLSLAPAALTSQQPVVPVTVALVDADGDRVPDHIGQRATLLGVLTRDPRVRRNGGGRASFQVATGGIELYIPANAVLAGQFSAGDLVEVRGIIAQRRGMERLEVEYIVRLGTLPIPAPVDLMAADLTGERHSGRLVRLTGRLASTPGGPEEAALRDRSGTIPVDVPDELLVDRAFTDRLFDNRWVTLTGIADQSAPDPPFDGGYRVSIDRAEDVAFGPLPPYRMMAGGGLIAALLSLSVYLAARRWLAERRSRDMAKLLMELEQTQASLEVSAAALRRSEKLYRSVIDHAPYGVYAGSTDGRLLTVNRALADMLGYESEADLLRVNLTTVYEHPDERARLIAALGTTSTIHPVDVRWKRNDGTAIPVRIRGWTVRDERGEIEGFECFVEDVSERQLLEDQLRQAQKMEAVGRLAGGVAHDFNNLLTVVLSSCEFALGSLPRGDPSREDVEHIQKAGQRAAALTRQLLAFSRRQPLSPQVLDLNTVVGETVTLLRRLVGEDVALTTVLRNDLGHVEVDSSQLEQVLINLVVNARDAMPHGGKITIETAPAEINERYAHLHAGVAPGRYVMLSVSDTGVGISRETQARLFEPFFTTKEPGKGTGLGLATVYGIVKQSEGHIWVYSEVGVGTTFKVYLPVAARSPVRELHEERRESIGGFGTVLLVEDETAVRALARKSLERRGYRVLEAAEGSEALRTANGHDRPIDVLVTDVVMPGMSGRELATRFVRERVDTKVLYMSGYTDDTVIRHGILEPGTAFLQKPFTPDQLTRRVRELLDGSPSSSPRITP